MIPVAVLMSSAWPSQRSTTRRAVGNHLLVLVQRAENLCCVQQVGIIKEPVGNGGISKPSNTIPTYVIGCSTS